MASYVSQETGVTNQRETTKQEDVKGEEIDR